MTIVATLAMGLAGCSSETPGNATPGDSTDGGSVPSFPENTRTGEESTEPTDEPDGETASLEPCELLEEQDLTELGLPGEEKEERDVGPARACQWQASGSHTVTVGVIDEIGIDEIVSDSEPEPLTVGSHQAKQYSSGGSCGVSIAVTDSSRVDVLGTANGDLTKGCDVAKQAAELVEPKLP